MYDLQRRLVTSSQTTNGVSAQRRFDYDRFGNRTGVWNAVTGGTQIQSINLQQSEGAPTNRITTVTNNGSTLNYTYDANGNLINDGVHTYSYDAENRLKWVDGGATAVYDYDYRNRRIRKAAGSVITNSVWEGNQAIAEHNGTTGAVIANYVYAGSQMIAKLASGVVSYFLSDRLSVRMTLDDSGNVIGRQAHLPFGEEIGGSGDQDKHRFTSYERDGESGTDYAVNRQYSQSLGRFMRVDPHAKSVDEEQPQSWNRYSYVGNDPINAIDPEGLAGCTITFHHKDYANESLWGAGHYRVTEWGPSIGPKDAGHWIANVFEISIVWATDPGGGLAWRYTISMLYIEDVVWRRTDAPIERQRRRGPKWYNVTPEAFGDHYWAPNAHTVLFYMTDAEYQRKEILNKGKRNQRIWKAHRGFVEWTFVVEGRDQTGTFVLCRETIVILVTFVRGNPVWDIF